MFDNQAQTATALFARMARVASRGLSGKSQPRTTAHVGSLNVERWLVRVGPLADVSVHHASASGSNGHVHTIDTRATAHRMSVESASHAHRRVRAAGRGQSRDHGRN